MVASKRRHAVGLAIFVLAVAGVAARATTARPADTPQLKAKRAEAAQVLSQISAIDERLSVLGERYDGARVHLEAVQARLHAERVAAARARVQYRRALDQVARLLVSLYTGATPSSLEAILGARSIGDMLTIADDQSAIAHQRDRIAETARSTRQRLQAAVASLRTDERQAAAALATIASTRHDAEESLAQRQRLLASVQAEVSKLEAQERARQERLLAAARARLAAEQRAQARAAAERAAQAHARAQVAAAAASRRAAAHVATTRASAAPAVADPPTTTAETPAPAPAPAPPAPPPVTVPASAADSQAAQIALGYIGVPYLWGGATPAGFDCSGLVSYVYAQLGIDLPHFAAAQYGYGLPVARDQLQPGDLVFFDNLDHVGIYIGGDQFVDAPHTGTFVRIDSLDDGWYSSRYVGARRP